MRAGRVALDGKPATDPALRVADPSRLAVDGKPLPAVGAARLWRLHKPRGVLVARTDARGRVCLPSLLPPSLAGLHPVGRLDLDSEGLLLLTDSAGLKRRLEDPRLAVPRRYRLRVFGRVSEKDLERLARGPRLDGRRTAVRSVRPLRPLPARGRAPANLWLEIVLAEGRNRELRRLAALFGWQVSRLIRTHYGPFALGALAPGGLQAVPAKALAGLERDLAEAEAARGEAGAGAADRRRG